MKKNVVRPHHKRCPVCGKDITKPHWDIEPKSIFSFLYKLHPGLFRRIFYLREYDIDNWQAICPGCRRLSTIEYK